MTDIHQLETRLHGRVSKLQKEIAYLDQYIPTILDNPRHKESKIRELRIRKVKLETLESVIVMITEKYND